MFTLPFQKSMPFLRNISNKVLQLATYLKISTDQLTFLEEAAGELLKARKVLIGSFIYAYYLEDHRVLFEYMQNELDKAVEKLHAMVCVRYLRTCQEDITKATREVRRRRLEFIVAVNKGLVIPETPPSIRKKRKRRMPGLFGLDFDDVVSILKRKFLNRHLFSSHFFPFRSCTRFVTKRQKLFSSILHLIVLLDCLFRFRR